ncbi:putative ankyrin repeat protein [Colletotrichum viniferum]|nr:putative ankyrin repeat protein [Colletotrichum viniferum]
METLEDTIEGLWSFSDHSDRHHQNVEATHPETCQWVFGNSTYHEWEQDEGRALFMTGPPGIGKSFLASAVIEELRGLRSVAYFFCDQFPAATADSFYKCILAQLAGDIGASTDVLSQLQLLAKEAGESVLDEGQRRFGLDLVRRKNGYQKSPCLIIDGIHELRDDSLLHLISAVRMLQDEYDFNILITSRCIFPQLVVLDSASTLEITSKDTDDDLTRYIKHRLEDNEELWHRSAEFVPSIIEGAEGIFFFATQIVDCVLEASNTSDARSPDAWKTLGSSLNTLFDRLLDSILSRPDASTASCAFNWLVYTERPLSMRELQHALAANATRHLWNTKEPLHQAVEPLYHTVNPKTILTALRGLVQVDKGTGVVRFFHSAAGEYFRQHAERFPNAQEMITEACVRILAFACLPSPSEANWVIEDSSNEPKRPSSKSSHNEPESSEATSEKASSRSPWLPRMMDKLYHSSQSYSDSYRPQHNPFQVKLQMPANQGFFRSGREYEEKLHVQPLLQYAACNWGYHARSCAMDDNIIGYNPKFPRNVTGLHLAAYFGLKDAAIRLLDAGVPASSRDSYGETPLWWAAKHYQEEVARLLSEKDKVTLHLLIRAKQTSLVEFLLDVGYNVNTTDIEKWTPLHAATKEKDVEMAERLIQAGADVDATDVNGTRPLSLAMEMRNYELIHMLVANQADTKDLDLAKIRAVFGLQASDSLEIYEDRHHGTKIMRQIPREFSWTSDMQNDTGRYSMNLSKLKLTKKIPGLEELGLNHLLDFKREQAVPFVLRVEQLTETTQEGSVWIYYLEIALPSAGRDHEIHICWNVTSHTDKNGLQSWRTTAHLSNLQRLWLPEKGIELFQSLVSEVQKRWSSIVRNTINNINGQRRGEVLEANGSDPNLLGTLLKDALRPVHYRRRLQTTVTEAQKFATDYCNRHDEVADLDGLLKQIEAFSDDVGNYIGQLDQITRDLIQMEFNLVSINEARQSVKMAASLKRLSWITFIFLPLTFIATSFGMNIDILSDDPPWYWYLPFAGVTILLTSAVWLIFKYSRLEDMIERSMGRVLSRKQADSDGRKTFNF